MSMHGVAYNACMQTDSVEIDGKNYISSARAAKLVGYTKDYIGQLARAGKIDARRIGRGWYIHDDSVRKHKIDSHYVLTKPKKKPVSTKKTEQTIKKIEKGGGVEAISRVHGSSIGITTENDDTPLFPVISETKTAKRELTRSNFTYESDRPATVQKVQHDSKQNIKQEGNVRMSVVEKKPEPLLEHTHKSSQEVRNVYAARMGAGISKTKRQHPTRDVGRVINESQQVNKGKPRQVGTRRVSRPATRSKVLPVTVAGTVFVLAALWYFFVGSGK